MAVPLDPSGVPIQVGNVILITPDLAGSAESYLPTAPGMRAAESPTEALDAALAAEGFQAQETVELTDTQEIGGTASGPTRSTAYDEPAIQVEVPDPGPEWGQALLSSDEAGVLTWNFSLPAKEAAGLRSGADAHRVYLVRRRVAPPDDPAPASRGLLGAVGKKILKIVAFKLIDAVAGEVGDRFVGRWEEKKRPYAVRTFAVDGYATAGSLELDREGWSRVSAGRGLLFVHGTFSQAHSAFGGLPRDFVAELHAHYGGRVIAFDHFTLSQDPVQNVKRLIEFMPDEAALDLDVVCHSRGGLVTRVLAEQQAELGLGSRSVSLRKVAFVGVPNDGTVLADADHLGSLLDTYTNMLNFFPDAGVTDVLQTVLAVVKQVAVGAAKGLDGLQSMVPGGRFLGSLNSGGECAVDYRAIGSDFEPLSPGLKDWVRDRLADGLFKADNDLVVPTEGVYGKNGSEMFPIESHLRLAGADAVGHTRYFSSHAVVKQLRSWLLS